MGIFITCFAICMICIVLIVVGEKSKSNDMQLINKKVDELQGLFDKVILLGFKSNGSKLNYVGFDNRNKKIVIQQINSIQEIQYNNITKVELIENGKTTMSVGNIVGGAVLLGGVGAILGGMNKKQKITSRKIKFSLNDFNTPSYEIDLLNNGNVIEYHIDLIASANKIMDTVKYIVENKQEVNL